MTFDNPDTPDTTTADAAGQADAVLPQATTALGTEQPRWALVTGASGGIGEATARALARDGWTLILAARRRDRLEALAAELNGASSTPRAHVVDLDVTEDASIDAAATRIAEITEGTLDLLVNNAGGALGLDSIREANVADWRRMFELNVMGTLQVTRALFPLLSAATAPLIVTVVSTAGRVAYAGGAGYNAAKFAETALTDVMRLEFAEQGIRVTQVDPGRVHTDFSLVRFKGDAERADAFYDGKVNLLAEDIADTIRWVASCPARMLVETVTVKPAERTAPSIGPR